MSVTAPPLGAESGSCFLEGAQDVVGAGIAQRFRVEASGRDAHRDGAGAVRGLHVMGRVAHDENLPRVERLAEQRTRALERACA